VEGIPPERKAVWASKPAPPAPHFVPEVKGLDSCPIALAAIAAIKTFQRTSQEPGQKVIKKNT